MLNGLLTVGFFILVWAAGTATQYLYWQKVRKLIHDHAKDHVGHLGTGMCKISFSRKAFVLVLTDEAGIITDCYELKGLTLVPEFEEMPGIAGLHIDEVMDRLPNDKYRDAFMQSLHAIRSSM